MIVVRMMRKIDFVDLRRGDWLAYAGAPALTNVILIAGAFGLVYREAFASYASLRSYSLRSAMLGASRCGS
jgi:hypothetical protein